MVNYDTQKVQEMMQLPPEEQTEDVYLTLDKNPDLTYGGHSVTEIIFWFDQVAVIYDDANSIDGWDQLIFSVDPQNDGTLALKGNPVGTCPPEEARMEQSEGAKEINTVYQYLSNLGIQINGY